MPDPTNKGPSTNPLAPADPAIPQPKPATSKPPVPPRTATATSTTTVKATEKKAPRDQIRESLETVVFVVVLVFLLKQFVVEAFVIPTGSMAESLYGYQKVIKCAECGFDFPLNSSREVEGDPQLGGERRMIHGYCCPNCRYKYSFKQHELGKGNGSGDRVLVHKAQYHKFPPERGDVVVFKYPDKPQKDFGAQNYIKRLWGLGGETIAIWKGDLYTCDTITYPAPTQDENGYPRAEDLWKAEFCYPGTTTFDAAVDRFNKSKDANFADAGGFRLVRKSDVILDAMKRSVWDNDHQSNFLANKGVAPRWKAETDDWSADNPTMPKAFTHSGTGLGWLRYRHLVVEDFNALGGPTKAAVNPVPVDNFLGYNGEIMDGFGGKQFVLDQYQDSRFWVGDLILECRAKVTDPAAEITLELSKGQNRFQAQFANGTVTLVRTGPGGKELATKPSGIAAAGTYQLKFANVDCSLRVWVDGKKIDFGTAGEYDPQAADKFDPLDEKKEGWTKANDVKAPASVGATSGVEVSKLKLWRDTYFINKPYGSTGEATNTVYTYYVQPGHYLCFGDNSAQSSDSRVWGSVPERLMLGKAAFVFFPLDRIGFIK